MFFCCCRLLSARKKLRIAMLIAADLRRTAEKHRAADTHRADFVAPATKELSLSCGFDKSHEQLATRPVARDAAEADSQPQWPFGGAGGVGGVGGFGRLCSVSLRCCLASSLGDGANGGGTYSRGTNGGGTNSGGAKGGGTNSGGTNSGGTSTPPPGVHFDIV